MKKVLCLLFVVSCLHVSPAAAADDWDNSEISFYVGGFLGDSFVFQPSPIFNTVEAVFDDDFTGGIRYAYFFNNHFALEVGAGFTPSSLLADARFSGGVNSSATVNVDTWVMHANMTAHLLRAAVIPYVTAGVGAVHFDIKRARFGFLAPSETDIAWNAGGGFKIPVKGNTALRFDSRVYFLKPEFSEDDTAVFTEVTGGVSILFDF